MFCTTRSLRLVLLSAAATTALSLAALWPTTTMADDDPSDPVAALAAPGETKAQHVVASGKVVRDAKSKTGWVVEVTLDNRGREEEPIAFEAQLTRLVSSPMSRAMPMPTTVWKQGDTATIAGGAKIVKRYPVPAPLGAQLTANAKPVAKSGNAPSFASQTFFNVRVVKA